jgi:hypothetical protein
MSRRSLTCSLRRASPVWLPLPGSAQLWCEVYLHEFHELKPFASVDSNTNLHWQILVEYGRAHKFVGGYAIMPTPIGPWTAQLSVRR